MDTKESSVGLSISTLHRASINHVGLGHLHFSGFHSTLHYTTLYHEVDRNTAAANAIASPGLPCPALSCLSHAAQALYPSEGFVTDISFLDVFQNADRRIEASSSNHVDLRIRPCFHSSVAPPLPSFLGSETSPSLARSYLPCSNLNSYLFLHHPQNPSIEDILLFQLREFPFFVHLCPSQSRALLILCYPAAVSCLFDTY